MIKDRLANFIDKAHIEDEMDGVNSRFVSDQN